MNLLFSSVRPALHQRRRTTRHRCWWKDGRNEGNNSSTTPIIIGGEAEALVSDGRIEAYRIEAYLLDY